MAEVLSTCASLRIFGADLDPEKITLLLGCAPTRSERRGEMMGPKRNFRARNGGWRLSLERGEGDCLSEQIARLLDATVAPPETWEEITREFRVDMFCGVWLDEPGQGLVVSPEAMRELGRRGIHLELDIYYPLDDQEEANAEA